MVESNHDEERLATADTPKASDIILHIHRRTVDLSVVGTCTTIAPMVCQSFADALTLARYTAAELGGLQIWSTFDGRSFTIVRPRYAFH